jgi:peptidoglycan/LPS O-acetylase OafA/YrhL
MQQRRFRNLLALAGPMFIGIASARLLYGMSPTRMAPLLVTGVIAFVGLAKPHQYGQLTLVGLAVFGVAGTITGVRGLLGSPAPARPVELVLCVSATVLALGVARRPRAREE